MAKFDKHDIEERSFAVFEDMIFLDEAAVEEYLDSCDAEYETQNFFCDADEILRYAGREDIIDDYGGDEAAEEALDRDCDEYDDYLEDLIEKYDITFKHRGRSASGPSYTLYGKYGNLKKFAKEYSGYIDIGVVGEHLYDCAEAADIDLESGDEELILGSLSK